MTSVQYFFVTLNGPSLPINKTPFFPILHLFQIYSNSTIQIMINQKLFTEVFGSVTSALSLRDKLNCLLVCKFWYDTIINTFLFETLEFRGSPKKFKKALVFFEKKPYMGQQVRRLVVEKLNDLDMETVNTLTTLFPNITSLN